MTRNIGTIDRVIRLLVGVLLIAAPFGSGMAVFETVMGTWVATGVGLVLLATSALKFCPLYRIIGLQTCNSN